MSEWEEVKDFLHKIDKKVDILIFTDETRKEAIENINKCMDTEKKRVDRIYTFGGVIGWIVVTAIPTTLAILGFKK
jgi:hypothetical protein